MRGTLKILIPLPNPAPLLGYPLPMAYLSTHPGGNHPPHLDVFIHIFLFDSAFVVFCLLERQLFFLNLGVVKTVQRWKEAKFRILPPPKKKIGTWDNIISKRDWQVISWTKYLRTWQCCNMSSETQPLFHFSCLISPAKIKVLSPKIIPMHYNTL